MRETANNFEFHEVDGMISLFSPLNTRDQASHLLKYNPEMKHWNLERFINHEHPTHAENRGGLRDAKEYAEDLAHALRSAYPEFGFVIEQTERGEYVTFYQRGENAPEESTPPKEPLPENTWCKQCNARRQFRLRTEPDPEFPLADWAECETCSGEILIRTWEVRVCIGPMVDTTSAPRGEAGV